MRPNLRTVSSGSRTSWKSMKPIRIGCGEVVARRGSKPKEAKRDLLWMKREKTVRVKRRWD